MQEIATLLGMLTKPKTLFSMTKVRILLRMSTVSWLTKLLLRAVQHLVLLSILTAV